MTANMCYILKTFFQLPKIKNVSFVFVYSNVNELTRLG